MFEATRKNSIDGQVRSCRLSYNRRMYFIRGDRRILATIYQTGSIGAYMHIIGSRRNLPEGVSNG